MSSRQKYQGFSLIEILVAIALVAILAAITVIAINPGRQLMEGRNSQRRDEISQIFSAINQYLASEGNAIGDFGTIPDCTATPVEIGTDAGNLDLSATLVAGDYISKIPADPSGGTDGSTGYTLCLNTATKVKVAAPNAENGQTIVAE